MQAAPANNRQTARINLKNHTKKLDKADHMVKN